MDQAMNFKLELEHYRAQLALLSERDIPYFGPTMAEAEKLPLEDLRAWVRVTRDILRSPPPRS